MMTKFRLSEGRVKPASTLLSGRKFDRRSKKLFLFLALMVTMVTQGAWATGELTGKFSVSATKQVQFSQGNLQYIGSAETPYWKFADNQWEYIGADQGGSTASNINRDLFGWATSSYNHGATSYQPYSTNTAYSNYYAYGNASYNLYDQTGKADWGYNAISNGGNTENSGWRTLTNDEWGYLFNSRTSAGMKYGHGSVKVVNDGPSVHGMIILPDTWTLPDGLSFTPGNSEWANSYTTEEWTQMEAAGAVFLPSRWLLRPPDRPLD